MSGCQLHKGFWQLSPWKRNKSSRFFKGGWLLLDNIQDPGNVGTMIRTADAAGLAGVILGKGTADIYNTKVLRSMQEATIIYQFSNES